MSQTIKRKAKRYLVKHKDELQKMIGEFLRDSKGKSEEVIKDNYVRYDNKWRKYAAAVNHNAAGIAKNELEFLDCMVYPDAFESSTTREALETMERIVKPKLSLPNPPITPYDFEQSVRVFTIVQQKGMLSRIISKLFPDKEPQGLKVTK